MEEPKNIQFIEISRTASGEMTDTAASSYPESPLCSTAKPSNAKSETNQNKATDVFTAALRVEEDSMARDSG